jgi:CRP/FNR family transcriptional regulator
MVASVDLSEPAPLPHTQAAAEGESWLRKLWEAGEIRQFAAGQHLFRTGQPATHLYKVISGAIRVYRAIPPPHEGRQIVEFLLPGDVTGLEVHERQPLNAQAITATRVLRVPKALLSRSDAHVMFDVAAALSSHLAVTRDLLLVVGRRNCEQALAGFLATLSSRNARVGDDPFSLSLPMSRRDIADYLCVTVETVSRTFTRLKERHIIRPIRRHRVDILDMSALMRLAGNGGDAPRQE